MSAGAPGSQDPARAASQLAGLSSITDEAVLWRPVGDPAVLRAQVPRLTEVAAMPQVTLQVVPFSRGGHTAASGSFTVLRFTGQDLPDVVHAKET